jgi:hypothetical protein
MGLYRNQTVGYFLVLCIAGFGPIALGQTAAEIGLQQLDATVQRSCTCAGQKSTGVQAALACTQELNTFASLKLENKKLWTPVQQQLAGQIERIIETCLSQALDYHETLSLLDIEAPVTLPTPPTLDSYRWKRIQARKLGLYKAFLIRINGPAGDPVKGIIEHLGTQHLHLRRARIDGGGLFKYNLKELQSLWVLLPSTQASGG